MVQIKNGNGGIQDFGRVTILLGAFLMMVFAFKFFCAWSNCPDTWCDEVFYIEPAVHFAETGSYAAPGLARQMTSYGVAGIDQCYYLNVPLGAYARVPIYALAGTDLRGRRIADWTMLALATLALLLVLQRWCSPLACLFGANLFVLHSILIENVGRPDNLSLALGLFAFAAWQRQAGTARFWPAMGTGFLVGLSGLAHQFGAVFWGSIIIVVMLVHDGRVLGWRLVARWLVWFGLGGLAGTVLPWLPQIGLAPGLWWQQYHYQLVHKAHLARDFQAAFWFFAEDAIQNPVLLVILATGLCFLWQNATRRRQVLAVAAWVVLLLAWRCWSFEPYNPWYFVHFWALLCILAGLAIDCLRQGISSQPGGKIGNGLLYVEMALALLIGLLPQYLLACEVRVRSGAQIHARQVRLLHDHIAKQERVLAAPEFFFDVPSTNKTLWMWGEKLDLNQFDAVVAASKNVRTLASADQWLDCLTPDQASVFMTHYELEASAPPPASFGQRPTGPAKYLRRTAYAMGIISHTASADGCYIYRNQHPH